jgi:hypothetical protein
MHITERTVRKSIELIEKLLIYNLQKIVLAYSEAEDDLGLLLSIKLKPTEKGHDVEVQLSFVESRMEAEIIDCLKLIRRKADTAIQRGLNHPA